MGDYMGTCCEATFVEERRRVDDDKSVGFKCRRTPTLCFGVRELADLCELYCLHYNYSTSVAPCYILTV